MYIYKPIIPVSMAVLCGGVYDFFHQDGYFPLSLKVGKPFELRRKPIWQNRQFQEPACIFHDPELYEWPVVVMRRDSVNNRPIFVVDHWKPTEWCAQQAIYANYNDSKKLARTMISDDPMRHANLGY